MNDSRKDYTDALKSVNKRCNKSVTYLEYLELALGKWR